MLSFIRTKIRELYSICKKVPSIGRQRNEAKKGKFRGNFCSTIALSTFHCHRILKIIEKILCPQVEADEKTPKGQARKK